MAMAATAAAAVGAAYVMAMDSASADETVVVGDTAQLTEAVRNATAGTTISVKAGTYRPTETIKARTSGTAADPIALRPYGDGAVVVDGSDLPDGSWLFGIYAGHWHVRDMAFTNSPAHGFVVTSSTGGVFSNLTTSHNGDSGFTLRGEGTNDNLVVNLDSFRNYDAANNGENADGIAVKYGSGTGNVIRNARLYENADDGLDLWAWESPIRIENSWAHGNGHNRWDDPDWQGDGNGYKLGGNGENVAHTVVDNAAWGNAGHGYTENGNEGRMQIFRNTAYANDKNGFYFADGASRLARNLAVDNADGVGKFGDRTLSAANGWDEGVEVPGFRSTDASQADRPRRADGSLPEVEFLKTGTSEIGAPMTGR